MKKILVSAIALMSVLPASHAQDSFYEGIAKYEGQEFQVYHYADKIEGKEGHYRPDGEYYKTTYVISRLESGLPNEVLYVDNDNLDRSLGNQIYDNYIDHQTYPSLFLHKYNSDGYVFIDDMLIQLMDISSDGLSFESVGRISVVIKDVAPVIEEAPKKKKLTMKEKIAAAKEKMMTTGASPEMLRIMDINLDEVITKYLADMKVKQKTANVGQEEKYVAEMKAESSKSLKERQSQSRELAAKMNANKGGSSKYTIKNSSSSSIKLITDSGSTTTLNAGSSTTYLCQTDIYYCVGTSDKGGLIANGDDSCGQTITLE